LLITCDVLEEDEGDLALAAELYEVGPLEGGLGEEDPVVPDDANRITVQTRETWKRTANS